MEVVERTQRRLLADAIRSRSNEYRANLWTAFRAEMQRRREGLAERLWIVTTYKGNAHAYRADSPLEAAAMYFQDPKPCGVRSFDMHDLRWRLTRNGGMEVFYMGNRVMVCPVADEVYAEVSHA